MADATPAPLPDLATPGGLFDRLRAACRPSWDLYVRHPFVRGLGDGSLPEASFRHYLVQDYLFLIHFARAYALAAYKADRLEDMRAASRSMAAILDLEMGLHVRYCAGWGLDEAAMAATPEATATLAYTRFVLERGMSGDLLDLHVALSPCIIGYAEIAAVLMADPATVLDGNPYADWIRMYADPEYRAVAAASVALLDRLGAERGAEARFASLARGFDAACRLEAGFWEMGWSLRD
ncbi:thiaminase II [Rhodospirillum centenum]|uniref:Aminopyrimidine aminohydrolase n=1 Tax=Rhodospirillum centenum (strain ATCC 51521 / SW) TaxID=414684 RepID=B6INB8_RHOCS|nr:thiaminase II [Rhodospirillum centenum]ACI99015.1 tena [Rhodospirillum centenum SW]